MSFAEMEEDPLPPARESSESPSPRKEASPSPEKLTEIDNTASQGSGDRKARKRHKKMVSNTFMDDKGYMGEILFCHALISAKKLG